jgi:hypothetical protein
MLNMRSEIDPPGKKIALNSPGLDQMCEYRCQRKYFEVKILIFYGYTY